MSTYIWSTKEDPSEAQEWCNKESNLKDTYRELITTINITEIDENQDRAVSDSAPILLELISQTTSYVNLSIVPFHPIEIRQKTSILST